MIWIEIAAVCFLFGTLCLLADRPATGRPETDGVKMASASYWVVSLDSEGVPTAFMWQCDVGDGMGLNETEAGAVEDMNAHMAKKHPQSDYVAPPIPE